MTSDQQFLKDFDKKLWTAADKDTARIVSTIRFNVEKQAKS